MPTAAFLIHFFQFKLRKFINNEIHVLRLFINNSKKSKWFRKKYSRTALETIFNRWQDDSPFEKLIKDIVHLTNLEEWQQWIDISEQKGIRVDIWRNNIEESENDLWFDRKSTIPNLLELWIGEEMAEEISLQILFPDF